MTGAQNDSSCVVRQLCARTTIARAHTHARHAYVPRIHSTAMADSNPTSRMLSYLPRIAAVLSLSESIAHMYLTSFRSPRRLLRQRPTGSLIPLMTHLDSSSPAARHHTLTGSPRRQLGSPPTTALQCRRWALSRSQRVNCTPLISPSKTPPNSTRITTCVTWTRV